jgi:hypothetical protein
LWLGGRLEKLVPAGILQPLDTELVAITIHPLPEFIDKIGFVPHGMGQGGLGSVRLHAVKALDDQPIISTQA